MNRKFYIVIGVIVLILAVVAGLLVMAVKKQNQTAPVAAEVQIKKVLDEKVISPIPSFDNNSVWYFNAEGRLFRVNSDGSGISEFPLPALTGEVKRVLWPDTGSDFIAVSGTGSEETKSYYSSQQKIYINLALNVQALDWMPDGKRIVYVWKSGDNIHQQLVLASSDGTGFRTIKDVFWPDLAVSVSPDGKTALMWRTELQDINKIYQVNLDTGEIAAAVDQGKNLGAIWVSANRFIFAQSSITAYPKIFLYDFVTKQAVDLELNTTLDKIAVDKDGKILYAAVPSKDNTGDSFIKLDLTSFKQEKYLQPDQDIRTSDVFLAGSTIYFTNTRDNKFYSISK